MTTTPRFDKVRTELDFPRDEREILAFWKEGKIFEKSLAKTKGGAPFVFYEGPPTANGLPHNGHVLTRVVKDLFPRYKTMRGYHVARKAGWDTHGLPVEVEVEKELHIHGKAAIEAYGVEPFVKRCIESVFRYTNVWEYNTERVAYWADLENAYVTYHRSYVESVWWALSQLFEKGLLYQGHKVVWWWAQGGTALSSAEVGLGYKEVDDPSVFVAFPLAGHPKRALAVWTTTPWTLPSNMYAAINPKYEYAVVKGDPEKVKSAATKKALEMELVVAKDLVDAVAKKLGTDLTVVETLPAGALAGQRYEPPFDLFKEGAPDTAWRVITADFVTLDAGTGIVHIAPAFGEDDFQAHRKLYGADAAIFCAVKPDGTFIDEMKDVGRGYAGRWVKEADKDLQEDLKAKGLLIHAEQYRHPYPFCWRSDQDPLIQLARPAWYIRTTQLKDQAIANNRAVSWLPEHIKEGRMGDFLANNVDWALSRERYWGTPLNVWINDVTGKMETPSSVDAILAKNPRAFDHWSEAKKKDPSLNDHLIVHKPWIDQVTWQNPGEEGTYRRVPEVIDCWFDSGCMPFAQWGFPHKGQEEFKQSFPADFISEAIDQTRGWFYSLLMISTLVFDEETQKKYGLAPVRSIPHPYKTCIVLGLVSDKEGKKESKSKGNYTSPDIILDKVEMQFAVAGEHKGVAAEKGTAFIAKEDLEGMDLKEGAKVIVGKDTTMTAKIGKGLPRRVVVLHEADRAELKLTLAPASLKPSEVPFLPEHQRVALIDPSMPSPGADAFRWFFYASNPPWSNTRHSLANVRELQKETLVKLRNVYSFFTIYANIDGFDPTQAPIPPKERPEIDRWILSELHLMVDAVTKDLDGYDLYTATGRITAFVDALSNWYVRRSRDRFWSPLEEGRLGASKRAAYETLYTCLTTVARVMAPFTPYLSDTIWRNLAVKGAGHADASVHLTTWPAHDAALVDRGLSRSIEAVRDLVSLGLQVRTQAKLKVRQPLGVAKLILADATMADRLAPYHEMIADELNVLEVEVLTSQADEYVTYKVKPNFRTLGQKGMGKQAQDLKKSMGAMSAADAQALVGKLLADGKANVHGVDLDREDVEVAFDAKEGWAAAGGRIGVVVLDTRLDDALKDLGYLRELLNRIQTARKELGLEFVDRIALTIEGTDRTKRVVTANEKVIVGECLATTVTLAPAGAAAREVDVEGDQVRLTIARS
ncbi:MAG: isoleucine--tRNA ligase [Labilithrix sp.]|nr:isoleucine--tRNA ligase [Labilithrix sp.]MCW5814093.1 isoleucine--tRNA ligase [Labilithrix sp.]